MHSPLAIANEFIRRAQAQGWTLTHMQLQKLVYLAHGWTLAVTGEPLMNENFEAWDYGPVNKSLFKALRRYGADPVRRTILQGDDSDFPIAVFGDQQEATAELTAQEQAVIDQVWDNYGGFPAFQLSALTHEPGTPWTIAYERGRNTPVANNAIQEYFVRLADPPA
jgi:uncharacterized phage-associated protein